MCNQAVSLVAAECERQGISSVTIVLLKNVAEKVRPPRALWVPFRHGYPLGSADDPAAQRAVIEAALALFDVASGSPPILRDFEGQESG